MTRRHTLRRHPHRRPYESGSRMQIWGGRNALDAFRVASGNRNSNKAIKAAFDAKNCSDVSLQFLAENYSEGEFFKHFGLTGKGPQEIVRETMKKAWLTFIKT